jgi:hypothetical protein
MDTIPPVYGAGEILDRTTFNWANMPIGDINVGDPSTVPPTPKARNDDIAALMFYAGLINQTNWNEYSGSASIHIEEINYHLGYRDTFDYNPYYWGGNLSHTKPETNCVAAGFGGHDYFFCPPQRSWADAQSHCASVGTNLVRIDSGDNDPDTTKENDFIVSTMTSLNWQGAWIGASDGPSYNQGGAEGDWQWRDGVSFWNGDENGEPVDGLYSNWDSGEPEDSYLQNCAEITSNGKWHDDLCNFAQSYICEVPVDQSWLLFYTAASIQRGLPVPVGWSGQTGGNHGTLIDGFRMIVPPDGEPEEYLHNNDNDGSSSEWIAASESVMSGVIVFMAPENYIYVYPGASGTQNGGPIYPYQTINQGIDNMPAWSADNPKGGRLWLYGSNYSYNYSIIFDEPMEITTWNGDASINGKLTIKSSGYIKVSEDGNLTVNP